MTILLWLIRNLFNLNANRLAPTEPTHDANIPETSSEARRTSQSGIEPRAYTRKIPRKINTGSQTQARQSDEHHRPQRTHPATGNFKLRSKPRAYEDTNTFVGFLQRAAELWARRETIETELRIIEQQIPVLLCHSDRRQAELEQVAVNPDIRLKDLIWELQDEIHELQDTLHGTSGLISRLQRLKASRLATKSEQNSVFRKIFRSCQYFTDESQNGGTIGKLKVDHRFCFNLWDASKEALRLEDGEKQRHRAWTQYKDAERRLERAIKGVSGRHEEIAGLTNKKAQLHAEHVKADRLRGVREALNQQSLSSLVQNHFIPALSEAGLVNTTIISPAFLPPKAESDGSLSPIDKAREQLSPDQQAALKAFTELSNEYESHCDALERFDEEYRLNKIAHLAMYTGATLEDFERAERDKNGDSYENLRAKGEANIRDCGEDLECAKERLLAAGLELPAVAGPADEIPNFNDTARRKIRKHLRDVARGKSPRRSTPSRVSSLGSPVRGSDWASAKSNSGSPGRVAKIRKYEPKIRAMRAEAIRERQRKLNEERAEEVELVVIEEDEE